MAQKVKITLAVTVYYESPGASLTEILSVTFKFYSCVLQLLFVLTVVFSALEHLPVYYSISC